MLNDVESNHWHETEGGKMLMLSRQDQITEKMYREQNRNAFLQGVIKLLWGTDEKRKGQ